MEGKNILCDPTFEKGFMLKGLNSLRDGHSPIHEFRFNGENPNWYLCQWNSKFNLINGEQKFNGKTHSIFDKSKHLTVSDGTITFRLNASLEYDAPRKPDESWPHILIEQDINAGLRLGTINRLALNGCFKLMDFVDYMQNKNENYHTAQFVWVVVLKNTNPLSPDFNRFMWVVVCLIDTRYDYAPLYCQQDKALPDGEFIYSFSGRTFLPKPLTLGDEVAINFDIYPYFDQMLAAAKKAQFLTCTNKEDLELVSTNMGFEVTGTYDIEIEAKEIAILV